MNMRYAINLFLVLLATGLSAQTQISPEQAVAIALEKNYGIRLAKLDARSAEVLNNIGNAGMLPTLDANGFYSIDNSSTKQVYFSGEVREADNADSQMLDGVLALNWTVFDGLTMFAAKDRLDALEAIGQSELRQQMEGTIYDVLTSYFLAVQMEKGVQVLREGSRTSRERLQIADAGQRFGSASGLAVVQARLDLSADSSAVLERIQQRDQAITRLNMLLGQDPGTPLQLQREIPAASTLELSAIQNDARKGNSMLQRARYEQLRADASVRELKGALFPRVDLFGNYGYTRSTSAVGFFKSNTSLGPDYGVRVSVPLFHGMQTSKAVEVAKLNREQAALSTELTQLQIDQQVLDAWSSYSIALKRVEMEDANLVGIRSQVDVALESYRLGSITAVELRDVQQGLVTAENRMLLAQYEAKRAELELKWLAGKLLDA